MDAASRGALLAPLDRASGGAAVLDKALNDRTETAEKGGDKHHRTGQTSKEHTAHTEQRRGAQRAQKGGPKAARPAPRRGAPRRPPGGGRTGGTRRNPPQGRARGALRRARNPTRQHTREAVARAAAAAALAGAPLATAKRACYRAGGVAGSLWARAARASQDPKATAGMGPRRLPRAPGRNAWAAHQKRPARPPQSCCGGTRAKRDASGPPRSLRRGPPSGPPQVHTRSGFARRGEAPSLS